MAKLTLLALAFTALVAFATAHTTIVTTVVEDENPFSQSPMMCRQQLQMQQLDKCQMYLQQGESPYVSEIQIGLRKGQQLQQQCCQQLQNVDRQCQCEAVQQVLEDAQRMQGRQQGQFGIQQQQMEQMAQRLPQQCRLQVREQECQIGSSGFFNPQQQCSRVQQQRFNQCQRFIQEAQRSSPRMMVSRQSQQLQQQLQQCCNELENVQRDCQCEAFEEVYRQAVQQQQQGGRRQQQPWQQGGQQQHQQQPWQQQGGQQQVRQAMEAIRNQCNIEVQQCRVPSAMF